MSNDNFCSPDSPWRPITETVTPKSQEKCVCGGEIISKITETEFVVMVDVLCAECGAPPIRQRDTFNGRGPLE